MNYKKSLFFSLISLSIFFGASCRSRSVKTKLLKGTAVENLIYYPDVRTIRGTDLLELSEKFTCEISSAIEKPLLYGSGLIVPVIGMSDGYFGNRLLFLNQKGKVVENLETVPSVFQLLPYGKNIIAASYCFTPEGFSGFSVIDAENRRKLTDEFAFRGYLAVSGEPYAFSPDSALLVSSPVMEREGEKIRFWNYDFDELKLQELEFEECSFSKKAYTDSIALEKNLVLFDCDGNRLAFYSLPDGNLIKETDLSEMIFSSSGNAFDSEEKKEAYNAFCVSREPFVLDGNLYFLSFFCGSPEDESSFGESHFQALVSVDGNSLEIKSVRNLDSSVFFCNPPQDHYVLFGKVLVLRWENFFAAWEIKSGKLIFSKDFGLPSGEN